MSAFRTVVLIPDKLSSFHDEKTVGDGITAGELLPGMLAEIDADGEVKPHSSAGGYAELLIVKEDEFRGMNVDGDVPSDGGVVAGGEGVGYLTGELCFLHRARPGDKLQMILVDGQTITIDDFLTSNGDGKLKLAADTDQRLFKAGEAVTADGADEKIMVYAV